MYKKNTHFQTYVRMDCHEQQIYLPFTMEITISKCYTIHDFM